MPASKSLPAIMANPYRARSDCPAHGC